MLGRDCNMAFLATHVCEHLPENYSIEIWMDRGGVHIDLSVWDGWAAEYVDGGPVPDETLTECIERLLEIANDPKTTTQ